MTCGPGTAPTLSSHYNYNNNNNNYNRAAEEQREGGPAEEKLAGKGDEGGTDGQMNRG